MFLNNYVFLPYLFLDSVVLVFENLYVDLCGTKKAVCYKYSKAYLL
jgi:hypothetical protein